MNKDIRITVRGQEHTIPNRWEQLPPQAWLRLVENYLLVEQGRLSVGELRIRLLCDLMGWQWRRVRDEESVATLVALSERLTFPFRIQYPDDNAALSGLSDDDYRQAVRTEPDHLSIPAAAHLQTLDWSYRLDLCFFAQLLPTVETGSMTFFGYKAQMHHGTLSTTLTALQWIEAEQAAAGGDDALPHLAAILYSPQPYDSGQAHALAQYFEQLDRLTLTAIRLNFEAIGNFLFQKTPFALLTKFAQGKAHAITTDMADALYDLSADGLGDTSQVERLNVLTYLRILRKKTIDTVRQLHGMKMELDKIASETGLPIDIVTKIIA